MKSSAQSLVCNRPSGLRSPSARSARWATLGLWGLLLGGAVLGSGCDTKNKPIIIKGPLVQPVAESRWSTMRATHRVQLDLPKGDGREQFVLRGTVAVERPDRFRLQGFGPGDVTLFDIIKVGGDTRVIRTPPTSGSSLQEKILYSISADLSATYDLEPTLPSRQKTVGLKEGELRITENERSIRAGQFKEVQGMSIPTHIVITNSALNYTVTIDVESANLDEKLDPALFRRPPS